MACTSNFLRLNSTIINISVSIMVIVGIHIIGLLYVRNGFIMVLLFLLYIAHYIFKQCL